MRSTRLVLLAALAVIIFDPAHADQPVPVVPPEIGSAPVIGPVWAAYRCSEGPVYNFYHGAYYGEEPPALHRGYAYRPYYRYTAYHTLPRTYYCVSE